IALYIARAQRRRALLLNLVMLPFWTSFLIRTYAWMFLLRDTGLVNSALESLHLIRNPLPLLFNDGAVILGLVYGYLPFMVLPLYATLEKLDPALIDAAQDLGATPWVTLWKIVVPLSRSGMLAGGLLVFIPCLGAYLTPDLLGGGKSVMVGNLVQNQFTTARDWPFGSAVSLLLMAAVLLLVLRILGRREQTLL
ncbi:MAG TPA: ABC transporter permease, partial [Verrucomicrobiae bacterium]|nr:ABC transporter permease [Verrucomicrobiae bacterium]